MSIWVHVLLHFCMRYTNGTRVYTAMIHVVFLEERVTITFLIVFMVVLKQVGLRVCFNNVFVSVLQCCMSPWLRPSSRLKRRTYRGWRFVQTWQESLNETWSWLSHPPLGLRVNDHPLLPSFNLPLFLLLSFIFLSYSIHPSPLSHFTHLHFIPLLPPSRYIRLQFRASSHHLPSWKLCTFTSCLFQHLHRQWLSSWTTARDFHGPPQ